MKGSLPPATVARLPLYLRALIDIGTERTTCSSDELAECAGVNPAQVRKDLSYLDAPGVRGVGYRVGALRDRLRTELKLNQTYRVAIAGAGNLGRALTMYPGFAETGFEIVALFDVEATRIGEEINGIPVDHLDDLERIVKERRVAIGIIATPTEAAQTVADRFVAAGVASILNFAPSVLKVEQETIVRRVDLSTELQILAYYRGGDGVGQI